MKTKVAGSVLVYLALTITILMMACMGAWQITLYAVHTMQEQIIALQLRSVTNTCMHYALHQAMQSDLSTAPEGAQEQIFTAQVPLYPEGESSSWARVTIAIRPTHNTVHVRVAAQFHKRTMGAKTTLTREKSVNESVRYTIAPWLYG